MVEIDKICDLPNPLWLTGPSGCGKTHLAKWLNEFFDWKIIDYETLAHSYWRENLNSAICPDDAIIKTNANCLEKTIDAAYNFVSSGENVVIDCLLEGLYNPGLIDFTSRRFNIYPVHIMCSPNTLVERRILRGGKYLTSAAKTYNEIEIYKRALMHKNESVIMTDRDLINFKLHDNYQEVFYNNKMIRAGARSGKRLGMIDWNDVMDRNVIDIGCSAGMLARTAKRSGADFVIGVDKGNVVKLAEQMAYNEGLQNINFYQADIESDKFNKICELEEIHVGFFCAILQWIEEKEKFVQYLDSIIKNVLYFETNLNWGKDEAIKIMRENTTFSNFDFIGESGDGEQSYHLWRLSR